MDNYTVVKVIYNGKEVEAKQRVRGLGDLVEAVAKPIAKALRLPCLDAEGALRPESGCAKRREKLNKLLPFGPDPLS